MGTAREIWQQNLNSGVAATNLQTDKGPSLRQLSCSETKQMTFSPRQPENEHIQRRGLCTIGLSPNLQLCFYDKANLDHGCQRTKRWDTCTYESQWHKLPKFLQATYYSPSPETTVLQPTAHHHLQATPTENTVKIRHEK